MKPFFFGKQQKPIYMIKHDENVQGESKRNKINKVLQ